MEKLYYSVLEFVVESGRVSFAAIQRQFRIGFARAVNLIDLYEQSGFIKRENDNYVINITADKIEELRAEGY